MDQGGLRVFVEIINGVSGEEYILDFTHTLSNGQTFVDQIKILVDDNLAC